SPASHSWCGFGTRCSAASPSCSPLLIARYECMHWAATGQQNGRVQRDLCADPINGASPCERFPHRKNTLSHRLFWRFESPYITMYFTSLIGNRPVIVGYARTSTADQTAGLDAQVRDLTAAGAEQVFSEQVSSVAQRAKLDEALRFVRKG